MDTLVLNRVYQPIHIISWKRAMSLLFQDAARGLHHEDFSVHDYQAWVKLSPYIMDAAKYVNTPSVKRIAVPEIIVLTEYDRLPRRDIKYNRENVFERDKHTCAYCGQQFKAKDLTIDHIHPRAYEGKTEWKNVISSCKPCNFKKGGRTPEQAGMPLRFHPKEPGWINPLTKLIATPKLRKSWKKFLRTLE